MRLLTTIFSLAITLASLNACMQVQETKQPETIQLAPREKYLVLDTTIFHEISNAGLELGTVKKHPKNPLFQEDQPWEVRFDNLYANVLYDEEAQLYKCWYNPFIIDQRTSRTSDAEKLLITYDEARQKYGGKRESAVCYAYSQDGITWVKPKLHLYPWEGEPSNIVVRQAHGAGIFTDPIEKDSIKKYKMFFRDHTSGSGKVAVAYSADGIHWSAPKNFPNVNVKADTHNNAFWAPTLNKYVAMTRDWAQNNGGEIERLRLVARTESDNFENWTDSEIILQGLEDHLQVYSMPVFYHHDIYIGLPAIFNTIEDRVHTELAWSKDTKNWHRVNPGTPLIPTSPNRDDYDWGCVYAAANPIMLANEIRLFYGASNGPHFGWRDGSLALATLRPDGFAGMTTIHSDEIARLKTHTISLQKNNIQLAADISPGGYIKVFIMHGKDKITLSKFEEAGEHDYLLAKLTPEVITKFKQKNIQLEFELYQAKLYAFGFQ